MRLAHFILPDVKEKIMQGSFICADNDVIGMTVSVIDVKSGRKLFACLPLKIAVVEQYESVSWESLWGMVPDEVPVFQFEHLAARYLVTLADMFFNRMSIEDVHIADAAMMIEYGGTWVKKSDLEVGAN